MPISVQQQNNKEGFSCNNYNDTIEYHILDVIELDPLCISAKHHHLCNNNNKQQASGNFYNLIRFDIVKFLWPPLGLSSRQRELGRFATGHIDIVPLVRHRHSATFRHPSRQQGVDDVVDDMMASFSVRK